MFYGHQQLIEQKQIGRGEFGVFFLFVPLGLILSHKSRHPNPLNVNTTSLKKQEPSHRVPFIFSTLKPTGGSCSVPTPCSLPFHRSPVLPVTPLRIPLTACFTHFRYLVCKYNTLSGVVRHSQLN